MNERIKQLAEQAGEYAAQNATGDWEVGPDYQDLFNKKFAELIVKECACRSYLEDSGNPEVEEALEFWRKDMLKHFGVEE